jgi:hypothetical protein
LRWLFTVVEELIKWAFESARQLFQRLNGRNRVAIFDTGNITTEETSTLLDITLGEFLFLAQSAKTITDNHGLSIPHIVTGSKSKLVGSCEVGPAMRLGAGGQGAEIGVTKDLWNASQNQWLWH